MTIIQGWRQIFRLIWTILKPHYPLPTIPLAVRGLGAYQRPRSASASTTDGSLGLCNDAIPSSEMRMNVFCGENAMLSKQFQPYTKPQSLYWFSIQISLIYQNDFQNEGSPCQLRPHRQCRRLAHSLPRSG